MFGAPFAGLTQTAEAVPRMKWKIMDTTASISRMWIKNALMWKTKKPPSHSSSNTNPRARNISSPLSIDIDIRLTTAGQRGDGSHFRVIVRLGTISSTAARPVP